MKFKGFWEKFKSIISKNEIAILPGHLAYYFVLSIIPVLTITFFLLSSLKLDAEAITNFISDTLSSGLASVVKPVLNTGDNSSFYMLLIFSFILASNGTHSIVIASNTVFGIPNASWLKRRIKAFILVFFLALLLGFIVVVPLLGGTIMNILGSIGIVMEQNETLFNIVYVILQLPVSLLVIYLFVKIIYTIAPDDTIKSRTVSKGARFTSVMWLLVTTVFSYYINNVASYDKFYGGLANIIILMLWFYFLAYIFVIGLAMNHRTVEEDIETSNIRKLEEISEKIQKEKAKK